MIMSQPESYDDLVLGSGAGGKLLSWHRARSGRRVAVVERRYVGGVSDRRMFALIVPTP
jgi:pyruvate/2-oxoglutarate dehydrogenase complex dihydrolipoamide dehydrogenase (E3) component